MLRLLRFIACAIIAVCASSVVNAWQGGQRPGGQRPGSGVASAAESTGSITVYVRNENGGMLPSGLVPKINLTSSLLGFSTLPIPQTTGNGWVFSGLGAGHDYHVEVKLDGYQDGQESVFLPEMGGSASVIVFMKPVNPALVFRAPTGQFVLAPKAQKEVQAALRDLRDGKIPSAQKHAAKAAQLAPANPYVQYVMGMTLVLGKQLQDAKPHLEQAVTIDPTQPPALLALGSLRYQLGDDWGAIDALRKDVQLDGSSWQAEWLLANSYLRQHKFQESREHAEQALRVGKDKAGQVNLALGQALAGLGEREKAADAFEEFAKKYPRDPNAAFARREALDLRSAAVKLAAGSSAPTGYSAPLATSTSSPSPPSSLLPAPMFEVPPRENWAPPDVDAVKPPVASEDACMLSDVLKAAGTKAEEFVEDLQKFSAIEDYQATEFRPGGQIGNPVSRQYNYLVFINITSPRLIQVKEVRGQESTPIQLPGRLQDLGGPVLALAFHRVFQDDFDWTCEGLGKWNEHPAWVVHFRQRSDHPTSLLASFSSAYQQYAVALKGRAWVADNGGQVLHIETDLVNPIVPADLMREHFAIDYAPVHFRSHHVELWLPENVDTYIQYQGHFLHHYHHFSNFKLFWVGATQTISEPKETDPPQE